MSIDSVEVSYLKPRNAQKIEDNSFRTSTLLKNLAVKVAERGRFCGTCRVLADRIIKKLLTMFPTYSALDIKAMVNNFALSIDTNMRSSDEEIQIFLNTLFPNGVYGTVHKDLDLWNTAICSLRISSLNLLLHQLTYDSKVLLTLSEAGVYDLDQNSMISFQAVAPIRLDEAKEQEINDSSVQDSGDDRSVDDYVGKKSEQRLNSDFISADNEIPDIVRRYDEEYFSLNKYEENSLTILYSEKDFDYKVGYGGTDISVLYEGEISQPSCQKRDGNSILACKVLDISLSANNWLDTIKCTLEAAVSISHYYDTTRKTLLKKRNQFLRRFNKRKRSGKSSHEEMMFLPSKSRATANSKKRIEVPTIRCIVLVAKLKSVLLTLSNHDNLLGLLMFDGLYVKFTDILNDFGQCKMKASLDSATAMDLSEAGSVHSEVFWKARNFDQLTSPLVRATLKQNTTENICHFTLSLVVRGLRVCFLYRFIQEMIEFAMLSIAQPLKVLIEKSLYIQSETLYDGAEYVSCTESSCDETCSDEESISKVRYSKGLSETYSKLRNKQGEPYQSDSAESSTTDYFSSDKSTGHDVTSVHLDKEDRKSRMVVDVVISLQDLSVILPRNSTSHELLAANLDSGLVHIYCTDESWSLLNPSELVDNLNPLEDDSNLPLHFDIPSNTWGYHFASVNETEDSKSKGCNSWEDQLLGESFDFQNFWQGKTDFSITENWDSEDDELQFFDALESCTPYSGSEKTARDTPITVPFDIKRLYAEKVFPRIAVTGTGLDIFSVTNSSRNNLDASAQSDAIKNTEIHLHWLFEEVRDKGLVKRYADQLASVPSNESRDVWRQMNNSHLNCTFVLDITDTQIRILVGDTADISTIAVALAQSEFYLILGMVFENIFEVPQFGTKVVGSAQKSENNTGAISSSDDSSGIDATFEPRRDGKQNFGGSKENMAFQSYGTKEYLEYLLTNRNHWLELVVVRAEVELKCLIDSNYFPMKIPSNDCLRNLRGRHRFDSKTTPSMKKSEKQSSPSNIHIPVALIKASGVFFHMVMDHDVIMMNFSCGNISVEDIRIPTVSIHPVALQVPSGDSIRKDSVESEIRNYRRLYGHSDFLFGFSEDYTSLECPLDKPVKFSFLSSNTSNWMTSNFGLCEPDLNLSNMDLIFLVSEYFSCYFRFAEFGHPSLSAYNLLDPSVIPYGATDTRVFLFKPHITIMSSPLQINSQTLVFDTDYGAYFRYILDTDSAVKMELKVIELALVLMKKFRFGKESRGLRGAAGSGRGVRTLVEFLNLDYFYQFSPIENQIDVKIDISNTSTEEEFVVNDDESSEPMYGTTTNGRRKIVKSNLKMKDPKDSTEKISSINRYSVELEPVRIPFPHCVFPLVPPDTEFTANSCDVVTGVEDLVLTLQLLDKFWPGGIGLSNRITSQNKTSLSSGKSRGTQKLDNMKAAESLKSPSMYMIVSFVGVRVILVDNILGLHLPLMQVRIFLHFATQYHLFPIIFRVFCKIFNVLLTLLIF